MFKGFKAILLTSLIVFASVELLRLISRSLLGMWSTLDIINYFIAAIIGGLFLTHLLLKNPKQIWGSSARLSFFVIFLSAFIINLFDFIPNFRVLDTFTFIPLTLSFFQDL